MKHLIRYVALPLLAVALVTLLSLPLIRTVTSTVGSFFSLLH